MKLFGNYPLYGLTQTNQYVARRLFFTEYDSVGSRNKYVSIKINGGGFVWCEFHMERNQK